MPAFSFSAGNGNDRINIVNTGATNDIGQLTIWENSMDNAVPSAMRKIRTLAMLIFFDSAASVLLIATVFESEGIGQKTGYSYIYLADEVEEPVVARIGDHRGLRSNADIQLLAVVFELELDQDREALSIA